MVDRPNKPSALASTPAAPPQPTIDITHDHSRVSATLPTGESVEVLLHGATVLSWKDAAGQEKLWLSETAALDGSAPVRGGIPVVFPVFGSAPDHEATAKLPQHGFARNSRWEFLGRSTSEGSTSSVKLDFGLSSENLTETIKALWPYKFGLIYSVSLDPETLSTTLVVTNDGDVPFDFQTLLHSYLKISDISSVEVSGLEDSEYIDKLDNLATVKQSSAVTFSGETDRIYTPAKGPRHPVVVSDAGKPLFRIVRDNLDQVVVWNPWVDKAASTKDFTPKDGWKNMVCVEPGTVKGWQKLEAGDAFEAAQTISYSTNLNQHNLITRQQSPISHLLSVPTSETANFITTHNLPLPPTQPKQDIMARGETTQSKVHFKGSQDDYLVFVDDVDAFKKWSEGDKTIPLAHFISSFKVFRTHNQGVQGTYDAAAKGTLESEFGTSVDDDVIKIILEKGTLQSSEMPERQGSKNDSNGGMVAH